MRFVESLILDAGTQVHRRVRDFSWADAARIASQLKFLRDHAFRRSGYQRFDRTRRSPDNLASQRRHADSVTYKTIDLAVPSVQMDSCANALLVHPAQIHVQTQRATSQYWWLFVFELCGLTPETLPIAQS